MSTTTANLPAGALSGESKTWTTAGARAYFASDRTRTIQTVLGSIWLLDGVLQFQSFMYSKGFITMLTSMEPGQPGWLHDSIGWAARTADGNLSVFNTLFALTQVLIGLGLLWRPTVKPALALSFVWALVVWWFGEAFGMLFMNMSSPLTGAPGAVALYAIIGMLVWPSARPGGLIGARGARIVWAVLWVLMAWLWLEAPSSSANATTNSINAAPSGMSWLSSVQDWVANAAKGNGLVIALVLALASAAIGIAVVTGWRARAFLALAIIINLAYWVLGEGLGGIATGSATDPNAAPLFILLAVAMYPLLPNRGRVRLRAPFDAPLSQPQGVAP
jgi:hypothetical protein